MRISDSLRPSGKRYRRKFIPADINREFERLLCRYTGAPYAVTVNNCCSAIFLCLRWWMKKHGLVVGDVGIPKRTYIGVPYAIRAAGFEPYGTEMTEPDGRLRGEYRIGHTNVWDSALRFTSGMYQPGQMQCLSFTGPYKHLKVGSGGAILLDDPEAYEWLMRAAFSGRNQCSYHDDTFDMDEGYNMYMPHIAATIGVHMMQGFPARNDDLCLPYPDWSVHPAFK